MSSFDYEIQESLKRRWKERRLSGIEENHKHSTSSNFYSKLLGATPSPSMCNPRNLQTFPGGFDEDLVSSVVPPVTVVLEGRSICQRICLDKHTSYQSLAKALRQMFVDGDAVVSSEGGDLDLSNAIPGHIIAYEDMENDLLLVGDLKWNDFVRVAKRIRILPAKANSRKGRVEN